MPVLGWQRIPVLSILRDGLEMPVRLMSRSEALLKVEEERVLSEQQPGDQTPPRILLVNVGVGIGSAISGGDSFLGACTSRRSRIWQLQGSQRFAAVAAPAVLNKWRQVPGLSGH